MQMKETNLLTISNNLENKSFGKFGFLDEQHHVLIFNIEIDLQNEKESKIAQLMLTYNIYF
jgi:hypothetical protein